MLGTIVNFIAIILGSFLGMLIGGGIPERINKTMMNGLALCVLYIGISGALKCTDPLLMVISIAVGAFIGELLDIDNWLSKLGKWIEIKLHRGGSTSKISEGFVTASLLFCVGAMAIVGSLESGLTNNNTILYTKSILDGITSILFASTLGIGVMLSSFAVLIYQGTITLFAALLKDLMTKELISSMSVVGSLIIGGLGLNMLGITKIKIANLLPAILVSILYTLVYPLIQSFL